MNKEILKGMLLILMAENRQKNVTDNYDNGFQDGYDEALIDVWEKCFGETF